MLLSKTIPELLRGERAPDRKILNSLYRNAPYVPGDLDTKKVKTVRGARLRGVYWDRTWRVTEGCSHPAEGCQNCVVLKTQSPRPILENLDVPFIEQRPTVYTLWDDLFHNNIPVSHIQSVYAAMAKCPHHTFIVLSRYTERMCEILSASFFLENAFSEGWAKNIFHGTSISTQDDANKIGHILKIPGLHTLAFEPLLEEVDITHIRVDVNGKPLFMHGLSGSVWPEPGQPPKRFSRIHSVIVGGELGSNARPMLPEWVDAIKAQCELTSTPFYFRHWGEWAPPSALYINERAYDLYKQGQYAVFNYVNNSSENLMVKSGRGASGRLYACNHFDLLPW